MTSANSRCTRVSIHHPIGPGTPGRSRCGILYAVMWFVALALSFASAGVSKQEESPWVKAPILIVVLDDVGWDLLERAEVPTIDALAKRSARFRQAWSYQTCTPARAALLTGRYGFHTGIGTRLRKGKLNEPGLPLEEQTLAEALPERVDAFGLWDVSAGREDPILQGFTHSDGSLGALGKDSLKNSYYNWRRYRDGERSREDGYATKIITDAALASPAPVRYVAYHAIGEPWEAPPDSTAKTAKGCTLAMLKYLDGQLARLLEKHEGYVFLLSDNATPELIGERRTGRLVEENLVVPFMVAGPGVVPGDRQDMVNVVDLLPTLLEMRGLEPGNCDGVSFLPALRGEPGRRTINYSEAFSPNGHPGNRGWALRDATHKIMIKRGVEGIWLYKMPGEIVAPRPLSDKDQAVVQRLLKLDPFEEL